MLGPLQTVDRAMRRFADRDEVDVVVVGVGSAGGVLVQRLARAGFAVVGIEAGPFWDTERDWVSDEAGSHKLYWTRRASPAAPTPSRSAPTTPVTV
jgi:choline dehydrogenase-like flavoprotein